ncbi:MAG TPA: DUF308 domain-containing protein [Bacteroidales bacterium]|nr:DUF308 domain-containing protein [Bacteroidales bacterium]
MHMLIRNWWIYLLNGIIALLYSFMALFMTASTAKAIAWYAGLAILLFGLIVLVVTINRYRAKLAWGMLLLQSVIFMAAGTTIMVYTRETLSLFIAVIGLLAIAAGIFQLIVLVNLGNRFLGKNLGLANALLTILFGLLLLINPFAFAHAVVVLSGIVSLLAGILLIWFGWQLRRISKAEALIDQEA